LGGFRRSYRDAGIGTDLTELVAVIHGADATAELVLQLLSSATVSVERFNKPPFVGPQPDQLEVIRARVAAGVRARDIYDHEAIDAPDTLALVRSLTDSGGSVRVARMVPMKLLLIDRSAALIPLSTSEPGVHLGALLVRASSLLEALSAFFEAMWDRAAPFALHRDARGRASSGRPDEAESLLAFLAAGFKDEAIARRLGVAPSTVDRRMRRLMHDLDARTRFQAGVHATRRGWVAEEAAADPGPFGQPNGAGRLGARRTQ
jgi:DNA-binding CsgD family transcriptional regulator